MKEFKLDKTAIKKLKLGEQEEQDIMYWKSKTPAERLEAAEHLRQQYIKMKYGTDPGFQRFCKIVKRK